MTSDKKENLIPPHGGYRNLKSYQNSEIVFDLTRIFCEKWIDKRDRTFDQMVQAARSGKQNIAEGSMASGTSKKTELKLINVARASLEELLLDYEDFLRGKDIEKWGKDNPLSKEIRNMAYLTNRTHKTYLNYFEKPEIAANVLICLIHQTNYLLDQLKRTLEKEFLESGGFTERLYNMRRERRKY
ncbi:MAG: four helix bundle suffix domain-containing protein [Candidatus Moraniibacteriota bacterium]